MKAGAELGLNPPEVGSAPVQAAAPETAAPAVEVKTLKRTFTGFRLSSLLKFAAAFYVCLAGAGVLTGLVLFAVAKMSGVAANFESFIRASGFDNFRMTWSSIIKTFLALGAAGALALTALTVLAAYLFNLVAYVFGGVEMSMVDDDPDSGTLN